MLDGDFRNVRDDNFDIGLEVVVEGLVEAFLETCG